MGVRFEGYKSFVQKGVSHFWRGRLDGRKRENLRNGAGERMNDGAEDDICVIFSQMEIHFWTFFADGECHSVFI